MIIKRIVALLITMLFFYACDRTQKEDIYILYTNDVASAINEGVSYAGVKGYLDEMKAKHKYVCLVDAGDFFDGDISRKSGGKAIVEIMNAVGYDVVAIGNQEFSIGLDNLSKRIPESKFDYVSCNLNYIGTGNNPLDKVKPYVIKKFGPTRIAFIGVTTPETLIPGKPAYDAITVNGKQVYDFYQEDEGKQLYEQVQMTIDKVKNKVDYIVAIAHLGSNSVAEGFSSYDLIQNTTGINAVIDGHSHTEISGEAVYDLDGNVCALTSTREKLAYLGVLTFHPDGTINTVLYPEVYNIDEDVQDLCNRIIDKYK